MRQSAEPPAPALRLTDDTACDVEVMRQVSGGFGRVYMGPNRLNAGMWVALKTLRPGVFADSTRAWDQFIQEGLTWVGLWPHANLLDAITVTRINGQPFIVLAYASHGSLRDLICAALQRQERLTPGAALDWAQQIAAGLVALHTPDPTYFRPYPLVHRDLKPENVLLDARGVAKITDFGLARIADGDDPNLPIMADDVETRDDLDMRSASDTNGAWSKGADGIDDGVADSADDTMLVKAIGKAARSRRYRTAHGVALGTPAYMAPEQWRDAAQAGPPADLYAFGLLLAELFTGRHALLDLERAPSLEAWRSAHFTCAPRPLAELSSSVLRVAPSGGSTTLPPVEGARLEALYQACLAKEAATRPTAAEALATLRQVASALGQSPYTPPDVFPHIPTNELTLWHNWANTYHAVGLHEEGLRRSDRAYALAPTHPMVLTLRADLLASLGRRREALAMTEAALAALPPTDVRQRMMAISNKGKFLQQDHRYAEADAAFAQALSLEPDAIIVYFNRAINCGVWGAEEANFGHTARAQALWRQGVEYAERAVARNPQNPTFLKLLTDLRRLLE